MGAAIFEAAQAYFDNTGETVSDELLRLLVDSVIDQYKTQRNYPDGVTDEAIDADVTRYFSRKKNYIATTVIPAMFGKIGAEGQSALIDNQVSRYWANEAFPVYLPDVVPYCDIC